MGVGMVKLHVGLFVVSIMVGLPSAASAQILQPSLDDAILWSVNWISEPLTPINVQAPEFSGRSFLGTAAVGGFGSVLGGLVGLYIGEGTKNLVGAEFEDPYLLYGAVIGSWLGGWAGAAKASERPGRSAFGSLLGVIAGGYAMHLSSQRPGGLDPKISYGLVHGLITGLAVTPWNSVR